MRRRINTILLALVQTPLNPWENVWATAMMMVSAARDSSVLSAMASQPSRDVRALGYPDVITARI